MVAVGGYKYKGGQPEEFRCRPLTLRCAVKGISWIHSPLGQNRVARHRGMKNPSVRKQHGYFGLQTYVQTSDRQHGYSGYMFGYSGHVFEHPIGNPDTPGIWTLEREPEYSGQEFF